MRALFALALIACGGAQPAPALEGRTSAPTTPPPQIAWRTTAFDTAALPRVARTGKAFVVAVTDNDGGRGYPNLRFEVRDRTDRVIDKHLVMTVNEYEQLVPDSLTPTPELERRIKAANAWLAQQHAAYDLIALRSDAAFATSYDPNRWSVPSGPRCAQCEPCENPPYIADVFVADGIDVVLVRVAYRGTDTCWEPSDQWHVVPR